MPSSGIRLQKLLSAAGVSSRRAAERLMETGRVTVNSRVVTRLGATADPTRDDIRVDGRRIVIGRRRYLLVYKPRGYVTTRADPEGRRTVLDLVIHVHDYVYPVGRLDYDSEGLLIMTNDGELAARLTHPRHGVERVYEALVRGVPTRHALARLRRGVTIDGHRTGPGTVRVLRARSGPKGAEAVLSVAIREGRNRQVRKMCDAVGLPVLRLRRVQIGPLRDRRLKVGECRELTAAEVAALKRAVESPSPRCSVTRS